MENLEHVKKALENMGIPYKKDKIPSNQLSLITSFGYEALSLIVDLTNIETVDAETGIIVKNKDQTVDNGIYIFTVLHSGQAGFIVVEPGTISRTPMVRKVSGDVIAAVNGIDMPPLMPYDMVEIVAHSLTGTFMKMLADSCRIPKEYQQAFLRLYVPKFLANVGMYFVGATTDDGKPMIYEEIVNMEPMVIWNALQKGKDSNESEGAGNTEAEETGTGEEGKKE